MCFDIENIIFKNTLFLEIDSLLTIMIIKLKHSILLQCGNIDHKDNSIRLSNFIIVSHIALTFAENAQN